MSGKPRRLRLSPRAEADLEDIWDYTQRRWSAAQAESYHADLVSIMELLAAGQREGRRCDIREGYFKCPAGSHVIFYRLIGSNLDVIRILHQRMDVERHL